MRTDRIECPLCGIEPLPIGSDPWRRWWLRQRARPNPGASPAPARSAPTTPEEAPVATTTQDLIHAVEETGEAHEAALAARDARIRAEVQGGRSQTEVAAEFGMSKMRVSTICARKS